MGDTEMGHPNHGLLTACPHARELHELLNGYAGNYWVGANCPVLLDLESSLIRPESIPLDRLLLRPRPGIPPVFRLTEEMNVIIRLADRNYFNSDEFQLLDASAELVSGRLVKLKDMFGSEPPSARTRH